MMMTTMMIMMMIIMIVMITIITITDNDAGGRDQNSLCRLENLGDTNPFHPSGIDLRLGNTLTSNPIAQLDVPFSLQCRENSVVCNSPSTVQ